MEKKELSELYSTKTLREIAPLMGKSHETVRQEMIELGLERRKRGRRRVETHQNQHRGFFARLWDILWER